MWVFLQFLAVSKEPERESSKVLGDLKKEKGRREGREREAQTELKLSATSPLSLKKVWRGTESLGTVLSRILKLNLCLIKRSTVRRNAGKAGS